MAEVYFKKDAGILAEIAEVAGLLWQRGWAERNGGNISVDVTDIISSCKTGTRSRVFCPLSQSELAGRSFFVKEGGARMADVSREPENNVLLITISDDLNGYDIVWGGKDKKSRPTSELISHLKIHQFLRHNKMRQKVFLHTHPTHLIALSHIKEYCNTTTLNELLFAMHPEVKINIPEGVGFAPYRCPGSEALADATVLAVQKHRVVIWEKHGAVVIAENVIQAFDLLDIVEKAAWTYFICKSAGYEPEGLNSAQLAELSDTFNKNLQRKKMSE